MASMRLVILKDAGFCELIQCRFRSYATYKKPDGTPSHVMKCNRGDCDNWHTQPEQSKSVEILREYPAEWKDNPPQPLD